MSKSYSMHQPGRPRDQRMLNRRTRESTVPPLKRNNGQNTDSKMLRMQPHVGPRKAQNWSDYNGYPLASSTFQQTMTKHGVTKRLTVNREEKIGKYRKVGRKKYFVRKEEIKLDCWTPSCRLPSIYKKKQESYFGSDTEDEDEKEYLKTAAKALDMNW